MKYFIFAVIMLVLQFIIVAAFFSSSYGNDLYELVDNKGIPISGKCKTEETCTYLLLNYGLGMRSLYKWNDGWRGSCNNEVPFHTKDTDDLPFVCARNCKTKRNCELWEKYSYDGIEVILTGIASEFMVRCWDNRIINCDADALSTVCN
jgi:hypothetical protein